ncbi:type IV pilus modification protein PilV [Alcanivorax quisquiliarum]|uniref:Type IV pilus modification protein PilV n=1 Tax=Alcanivorax quisquiliarum TaxID=2933565 RepID=A0ABT0E9H9_9GAMM|nr:type IV pilus modification protein PilV [Alcanivorax quisquiliarum]MCK0538498.1 type IV pilus modification protein PilV [Alcanivorax quisquiliarum]
MLTSSPRYSLAKRDQQGVGLIEVLVAVLVIAVGVLGYAAMQLFALQSAEEASYRTHAALIARDALERLLLNADPDALADYFDAANWPSEPESYGGDYPDGCTNTACDPQQLAAADISQLAWAAANSLPAGMVQASDDCGGVPSPSCVVVTWMDMTPEECLAEYPDIPDATDYHCVVLEALRP